MKTMNNTISSQTTAILKNNTSISTINTTLTNHQTQMDTMNTTATSHKALIDNLLRDTWQMRVDVDCATLNIQTLQALTKDIPTMTDNISTLQD